MQDQSRHPARSQSPAPRPTPTTTTSPANGAAEIRWTASVDNGGAVTHYTLTPYKNGTAESALALPLTARQDRLTGLTNGAHYQFAVADQRPRHGPQIDPEPCDRHRQPGRALRAERLARQRGANHSLDGRVEQRIAYQPLHHHAVHRRRRRTRSLLHLARNRRNRHGSTNGKRYTFTISAVNGRGYGPKSGATGAVTVGAPLAPNAVHATAEQRSAIVQWKSPDSDNGATITGYVVTPYDNGVAQAPQTFHRTATTETVTGLTTFEHYTFEVGAINARGTGPLSAPSKPVIVD